MGSRWQRRAAVVALAPLSIAVLGTAAAAIGPANVPHASVSLFSTSDGAPLFPGATSLEPGEPQSACIDVTAQNTGADNTVMLAAVNVSGPLASVLDVDVDAGPADASTCGSFTGSSVYTGTLADFAAVAGDGVDVGWHPASANTWRFRITVTPQSGVGFGVSATADFSWRLEGALPVPPPAPTTPADSPTPTPTPTPTPSPTRHVDATDTPAPVSASPTPTADSPTPWQTLTVAPVTTPSVSPSAKKSPSHHAVVPVAPTRPNPPHSSAGPTPTPIRHVTLSKGSVAQQALTVVKNLGALTKAVIAKPQYPLGLVALAGLFVLAQGRLDRRDPKLALAPVRDQDLRFGPGATEVAL